MEDRQEEGCGLAGARLGAPHEVPLGLHNGNSVFLDGRRLLVSGLIDVLQQDVAKISLLEGVNLLRRVLSRNFGTDLVKAKKLRSNLSCIALQMYSVRHTKMFQNDIMYASNIKHASLNH